ncbi:hypothetical protein F2Q69_00055170 [Brassica cretica]|uniref:Uncharacterized protein n=1 Tax=Brassica cretica TaxID=69181 RepID=A0A8S9MZL1_BRACR|nr:hypothetical protein F2Q69_00055170 [Brassica cretica]
MTQIVNCRRLFIGALPLSFAGAPRPLGQSAVVCLTELQELHVFGADLQRVMVCPPSYRRNITRDAMDSKLQYFGYHHFEISH